MALTVETGAGLPYADALIPLSFADSYHLVRGNAGWDGNDDAKEAAIRRASTWLSNSFAWAGFKVRGRGQALAWPRSGALDRDGWSIPSDEVPDEVRQACAEAALRELVKPGGLTPDVTTAADKVLVGVGSLRWQARGGGGVQSHVPTLTVVRDLIAGLLVTGAGAGLFGRATR